MSDSRVSSTYWELWVNNIEITGRAKACIDSIDFDEVCDGSDTCTLTIKDPDFIFIEDNIFIDEASVYLRHGFNEDADRFEFKGYISAIDITFPEDGSPTLTITCFDNSHLMNRRKNERSWDNVTRADVVSKIAAEYGFTCSIEPNYSFPLQDTISQSNQTDIEFLESLAKKEREPFMCKLDGNTLIYRKKGLLQTAVAELGYKTFPFDVVSFTPQITKETRQEEITASNVDSNKNPESYTANDGNVSRDVQGESIKTTTSMVYNPTTREWEKE